MAYAIKRLVTLASYVQGVGGEFEGIEWSDDEVEEESIEPHLFPINQLQLVCQQLHQETKALDMRYNTIFFTNSEDNSTTAPQKCAAFLRRLREKQANHMRVKVLNTEDIWHQNTQIISDLVLFCKKNPPPGHSPRYPLRNYLLFPPGNTARGATFVDVTFDKAIALSICDMKLNELVVLPSQGE
ncbi:hypothetical protein COCMIDRAFT_32 [Bipolaris oryzae ATCC 44560]|uniref:Uncharacterized protein n=1 Tax=Bipolaris oryzae ATCC 44560 TaxID=930090 RepID=W6ZUM0_COCMI|nr:uncharacterized protein COCMIDRAFT_32 [Bipolaris oryzae ATCC 44560]EUC51229.1 hypothetical protein COCMIDRAFT_32 [Bipolaris oryzae ATCC 44560]